MNQTGRTEREAEIKYPENDKDARSKLKAERVRTDPQSHSTCFIQQISDSMPDTGTRLSNVSQIRYLAFSIEEQEGILVALLGRRKTRQLWRCIEPNSKKGKYIGPKYTLQRKLKKINNAAKTCGGKTYGSVQEMTMEQHNIDYSSRRQLSTSVPDVSRLPITTKSTLLFIDSSDSKKPFTPNNPRKHQLVVSEGRLQFKTKNRDKGETWLLCICESTNFYWLQHVPTHSYLHICFDRHLEMTDTTGEATVFSISTVHQGRTDGNDIIELNMDIVVELSGLIPPYEKIDTSKQTDNDIKDKLGPTDDGITVSPEPTDGGIKYKPEPTKNGIKDKLVQTDDGLNMLKNKPEPVDDGMKYKPDTTDDGIKDKPEQTKYGMKDKQKPTDGGIRDKPVQTDGDIKDKPESTKYVIKDKTKPADDDIRDKPVQTDEDIKDKPESTKYGIKDKPKLADNGIRDKPVQTVDDIKDKPESTKYVIKDKPKPEDYGIRDKPVQTDDDIKDKPESTKYGIKDKPKPADDDIRDKPVQTDDDIKDKPESTKYGIKDKPKPANDGIRDTPVQTDNGLNDKPELKYNGIRDKPKSVDDCIKNNQKPTDNGIRDKPEPTNDGISCRDKPVPEPTGNRYNDNHNDNRKKLIGDKNEEDPKQNETSGKLNWILNGIKDILRSLLVYVPSKGNIEEKKKNVEYDNDNIDIKSNEHNPAIYESNKKSKQSSSTTQVKRSDTNSLVNKENIINKQNPLLATDKNYISMGTTQEESLYDREKQNNNQKSVTSEGQYDKKKTLSDENAQTDLENKDNDQTSTTFKEKNDVKQNSLTEIDQTYNDQIQLATSVTCTKHVQNSETNDSITEVHYLFWVLFSPTNERNCILTSHF